MKLCLQAYPNDQQPRHDNNYGRLMTHAYCMPYNGQHALREADVTTTHVIACNNGGVYTEVGHVVEDHVMSHDQEEYIDIAVNKLFNGECELGKDEGHDTLPSINSLLMTE